MSRQKIDAAALRQSAITCLSWSAAAKTHEIGSLFTPHSPQFKQLDRTLELTDQALRMLRALNDFDRRKVAEELVDISKHPNKLEADVGRKNWFARLARTRYPFKGYHFKISYAIHSDKVIVDDVFFDLELLGSKDLSGIERNALYLVSRKGNTRFTDSFQNLGENSEKVVDRLEESWSSNANPTHRVETSYAAVNGMLNPLAKATWLMGTHLDAAYPDANPSEYTLFHNPSDSGGEDIFECVYDKRYLPARSHNVHHFAAVLYEAQSRGHKTQWVAHSQGAIIFSRAVNLALRKYGGSLNCHSVSLHGAGCNLGHVHIACARAGITVERVRNNPFDMVPNAAGGNDLSRSGLARSLKFRKLVLGDDPLASPHTLPYLGLETYIDQLEFSGNHEHALYARRFRQLTGGLDGK